MAKKTDSFVSDEILTQEELADRWKTSKRFIVDARSKYGLPYFKVGRLIRFKKSEADSWFDQRRTVA